MLSIDKQGLHLGSLTLDSDDARMLHSFLDRNTTHLGYTLVDRLIGIWSPETAHRLIPHDPDSGHPDSLMSQVEDVVGNVAYYLELAGSDPVAFDEHDVRSHISQKKGGN